MTIYAFFADGFEEVEAIAPIDVCRRAGITVKTVSITSSNVVTGARGIPVVTDSMFADNDYSDADLLFLPGGMPGSTNLDAHEGLRALIMSHFKTGKMLAAICAAPLVYGHLGILKGVKATCYPGVEPELAGAQTTGALVEKDGQFMTGKGPGAALALGYMMVEHFCDKATADALRKGMIYNF